MLRGPNEIDTEIRSIIFHAELGSRCGYCDKPHELIDRPGDCSRLGFKVTTHSKSCTIGKLRVLANIPDTDYA